MADCVSLIQSSLETLKSYEKNILNNEGSISDTLKKIKDIYLNYSLKKQERAIANAYLLSKESGILSSLRAFLCLKNCRSIKLECFRLLDDIIELSSNHIQEYGEDIQDVCLLYVMRDIPADVKKACLITLSKVLEACRGFHGEKKIKPQLLIEELFKLLCRGSKLSAKVKEEVLCLIGIIAHYYPEDFLDYQERVLMMYLQELKTQVKAKAKVPDYYTIAGCLQGLKEYLYNFPVLCSEDEENSYFIFDISSKMAIESEKFRNITASGTKSNTTSSACKAGLQMIAAHASQFSQFVFEDCKNLYSKLMKWVEQENRDMQKLGRDAVIAVLKVTSEKIMSDYENDEINCKSIFKFFMEEFREIFLKSSDNDNSRKLHIAVIGYGLFAGPCKLCLPESKVKGMLQNIIQKGEYEFFSENKNLNDNIMVLPCYIESVASILSNIDFIPENILFEVEKLVIFQFDKFPKVPSAYHFVIPKSIIHVFIALQPKGEVFMEFLSEIVYQGLVRTCSHPVVIEAESMKDKISAKDEIELSNNQYGAESNVKIETYKDYMYLWKNILNVVQLKELSVLNITLQERQYLMECIYDQIIRSSLDLISKLDLTLQQQTKQDNLEGEFSDDDEDDVSSDPLHGFKPNNREDYYIFLNIVEFLKDLLIDSCTELFSKWVYPFGREMIFYATHNHYHSGFYKLISLNLSICQKINYFKPISRCFELQDSPRIENVVLASFNLFSKFVKELVGRLQQFKDELLASCLQVLLVLPTEIVLKETHILISALEVALKLGMSYLPLATNAVSALEQWSDSLPSEKIKPYFPVLLPYLNNYITASGSHDACSIPLIKETRPSKIVHKMSTKMIKRKKSSLDTAVDDPEFEKLQLKIIKFLGRLGENNSALLENAFENVDKVAIAWDSVYRNHLKYAIPFVDMKPDIYFDDFLPRVLEVALKSSVRQVKVAACETLHSLVLYMIGKGSQMPDDLQDKFSMEALYENLFPGLLELACDVEQVAKQLFYPLVFQIIHWFTHSKVIKTPESSMILKSLWDGVTHKENASLRDLSAICLREYFQWFLKQSSQGKKKLIETLLNKLTSFSLHPSPYKRMGAALTFNNIYKIFRAEEDLVKKYTIQLLVQFIDSLAIAHNDDKSIGTQKQCITALGHLEKIVIVKHKYFLKASQDAKVPSCLKDSSLMSVTQWLLWQCGSIQTECRHKCMNLVAKFSTLIPGIKTPVTFLLNYNVDERNIFEDIFERSLRNKTDLDDLTSFKSLSFWLEALLASLECYHWAFSEALQLQTELNVVTHASLLSSIKIFNITSHFLTNIIKEALSAVTRTSVIDNADIFTPDEELKYNRLKCSILVRLMSLIPPLFKENAYWFHEKFFQILWTPDLWEVLMLCTVHPSSIGFDMNDPEIFTNLPKEVSNLHKNCLSKREDFQEYCEKFLFQKKYYLPKMLPLTLKDTKEDPLRLLQIFTGYELLISCGLWSPKYTVDTTEHELIENILNSVINITAIIDSTTNRKIVSNPVVLTIAEKMLVVAYTLGLQVNTLALRLTNTKNQDYESSKPLVFSNFTKNICEFVAKKPSPFVQTLVENLSSSSFTEISVLLKFIDFVARTKNLRKRYGKDVIEAFLSFWHSICSWANNHPDIDSLYSVISIMQKMLLVDSEVALNTSGIYSMSLYPSYVSLLKKEGISFDFIVQAFNILPFFVEDNKIDLRECLEEIIANHFPLTSTELKPGSSSYHTYISALKKLFTALYLTGCNFLLEILTVLICKESSHVLEDDFKNSIIQMVKRTQLDKQHTFADFIFNIICIEKCSLKTEILIAILEKVLVLLVQRCKTASFINFFLKHIKTIMAILKGSFTQTAAEDLKIVKRIYGFRLTEILYGRLTKDLLHSKESQIVETYLGSKPQNGNELTTEITKLCIEFKRTSFENEPLYKELYRKLNCVRYNTLIAVVACTQNELKFYSGILFKEYPIKNERIWERIVDKEQCLKFDMELDSSLQRKKKFITMRHQMRNSAEIQDNETNDVPSSLQLLGSESLGLSSLAEDASKFVFSTEEQVFNREKDELPSYNEETTGKTDKSSINVIELEDDDLNKHECMFSLSWLIKHMKLLGLIPPESCEEVAPSWINFLAQSLEDSNSHDNIKLFIGRLIVNNAVVLQPYAKFLLKPMMKLIVSGIAGKELNCYILDVIITLLSWSPTYVPEDTLAYETSELLKFVIKHCDHSRREIFKNNMEVIKTILECWKNVLEIPYDEIYQKMNHSEADSKKNFYGIQLLGVVILCNFPPYDPQEETRGMSYLNILLRNLSHKYKEIHGSAAEVISLILKYFAEKNGNIEKHPFFTKVLNLLENMISQKMESNFLYCLNKIHIGCPKIADRFISKLLFLYPSVYGVYANYILEVVCSRVEAIPDAFKALKLIGLFKDMEKKSETMQFLSLQALEKLIPSLNCDDLLNILPDIVEIHSQPSVQCRLALYKILFVLYEKYVTSDGAKEKEITRLAKETLIAGLADPDQSVRLTVDNFWSDEKRLPSSTKDRLIALLKNLYSPSTEESFLQYATFLLLERTSNSPDYKRKIFEHPLTQCNFQTYQIQISWRKRNVAMSSPLFTETVSNSLSSSLMMGESFSKSLAGEGNFVKATQQDYDFPETVDSSKVIKSDTYNWLTGESMDTYAYKDASEESFLGSFSGSADKSYLFALKSSSKTSAKEIHTVSEAKKKDDKKPEKSVIWMLKRRFWKDKGKSDMFAKQELRRQDRRKEIQKEQQSRREAQVVMYRSYRIGELPDIEISNSALIAPIQALAMNDVVIAKLLFKSIVVGVCSYVKEDCPEEHHTLLSDISSCFEKILSTSYTRTPSVISFCLESLNSLQDANFDAEHVFVASIGSNQQSIGILLLETKILQGFEYQPSLKKKRSDRQKISEERNSWMKLAELYKSLNDYDVVNGVFSLTMGQRKENRKALQYEASGYYFDAYELYNELYENTSDEFDQAEKDFWDKSLLSCLDKLTKWESLETVVTERFMEPGASTNVLQLIWQDQYVKDNYLPYWIRSKMKLLLKGKQDQTLLDFFDAAKKDEENKIHLENFAEDLALLYILQDKFDIARQFSSTCFKKFLKDWKNLSPLAVNMQLQNLQNLLKYTELDEFLYLMKNDKFLEMSCTSELLKSWQKRYPSLTDPVNVWDDMCCNRQLYLKKLQSKIDKKNEVPKPQLSTQDSMEFSENNDEDLFEFKNNALTTSALTKIHFAENAAEQKNFPVALKNLKDIYKVSKSLDQVIWSKFIQCYCSVNNKRCHSFPEKKLDILLQSLKELSDLEFKCGTTVNAKNLQSQTFELLSEMFSKGEVKISSMTDKQKESFTKFCGTFEETVPSLLERSFLCLNEVISIEKSNKTGSLKNTASAHMALAKFCNKYLRKEEDSDFNPRSIPSYAKFPIVLTQSLLTALENGISEAFLLFPRLLQIIEQYPKSMQIFKQKVSKMPCWLFIGWINQLVALLDKSEATAIHEIIENITCSYPEAIIYAFHLSYENYKFPNTVEGKTNKAFVEKIKSILGKQKLITDFVAALEQLSVPAVIFKDYIDDLNQLINNKASKDEINSVFQEMFNNLFNIEDRSKDLSFGPVQKKFAEMYKDKVLKICGKDGQKLSSTKSSERVIAFKELADLRSDCIATAKRNDMKTFKLKHFSPWLSDFQSWIHPTQIEIPGQYTGKKKPLPEYHVKISGFDEKVMVLSSITIPRRITIRGNDEKEYKILVKAGEDLRQDARIQQMFSVMNEIFRDDIACKQRHISLKTYQVIPLNNRLGLIEWLDHTTVLQSFMFDGMKDEDREKFCKKSGSNAARDKFMQWVKTFKNFASLYMTLFKEKSREECVQKFQEIADTVPKNLLVNSFWKLSSSPEAFVALRTRFATSHAAICIAQWILGIGDRHLGNFLVDKRSGYEIGIDFGHAFGSATQFLPVPELIPFRLTPQYLQLLSPLKEKGLYEATMVHTLSALQNKSELLFNMMDIFIKEPTLDWKVLSRKQQLEWGGESTDDDDWFPKQRIALARKKLEGVNPSYITRQELELGHGSKECFKYMESVCLGSKEHNVRAKYSKTGLSSEEQVDCLIDQATDPHVLCLTYCGWNSWM